MWQVGLGVFKCNGKHTCSFLFIMSIRLNEFKIALTSLAILTSLYNIYAFPFSLHIPTFILPLFCINLSYLQVPLDENI